MAKRGNVTGALWRAESWELIAKYSFFFLSLDNTATGAENLRGGLHAAPVTGNDAVVAAPSLALRQFLNSSGVTKIKENLDEEICFRVSSIILLPWFLVISCLELEPA
jgi:hypothetical protein